MQLSTLLQVNSLIFRLCSVITMGQQDVLYSLAMGIIRLYRFALRIFLSCFAESVKTIVIDEYKTAGVTVNGSEPHDIKVYHKDTLVRFAYDGSLGMGESYVEGWWDCDQLDELCSRIMAAGLPKKSMHIGERIAYYLQYEMFNLQTRNRASEVAEAHYNLGNKLFESFLDPYMNYSCGYWKDAKDLDQAQKNKMDLIARKLKLKPGMRVLDIGCGWGGLCKFLAEHYEVHVVGVTISVEGAKYAEDFCKGLNVDIRLQDYRDINEEFDRIVSVGMFEHVGQKNYREYFQVVERCLVAHGLFLLHTIGHDHDMPQTEPWLTTYIFPNGILPNHKDIPKNIDNLFTIEDWHNFGADYDKTLMAWYRRFLNNWPRICNQFDNPERFFRLWTYYLTFCAGYYRARKSQLWQIVLSKKGVPGGYESVR